MYLFMYVGMYYTYVFSELSPIDLGRIQTKTK